MTITEKDVTKLLMIGAGSGHSIEQNTGIRGTGIGVHTRKIVV